MGKKSGPKPPDYSEIYESQLELGRENAVVAREQLAWGREQDRMNREVLERVLGVQLPIMEEQFANAQEDRQRYEEKFLPLEDALIEEFQNYGTPERYDKERGRAVADVSSNFDAQRKNALTRLESYGIDPSQTRNQALDLGMRTAQAAVSAGAADAATQRVENTSRALRAEGINIGRGMPSQVAQSYGQSIAAGQAGIGGNAASVGSSIGAMQSGIPFGSQAYAGYGGAMNTQAQSYADRMARAQYQQAGLGQWMDLAGGLAGAAMPVQGLEAGGVVPEQGALPISPIPGSTDRKAIMATPGEFVVPKDVTEWKGIEFFEKLASKSREDRMAIEIEKRAPQQPPQAIPVGA
jgi:hypothetical protein